MLERLETIARKYLPQRLQRFIAFFGRLFLGYPLFIPFRARYNEDGLISAHNVDFIEEPKFKIAYERAVAEKLFVSPDIRWRLHVACWAGTQALALKGDFVECGVNKGFMSRIVMDYLDFDRRNATFYLLDTFQGFDEKYLTPQERRGLQASAGDQHDADSKPWQMGAYEPCYDVVVRAFNRYDNVRIIKGAIPETLAEAKTERVAYLSIDMNCVYPEIAAIEHFWPKLVQGGIVILDDYGWSAHFAQKLAMDAFAIKVGTRILSLPTGQGLIIKT
jgi:hypothetical protein